MRQTSSVSNSKKLSLASSFEGNAIQRYTTLPGNVWAACVAESFSRIEKGAIAKSNTRETTAFSITYKYDQVRHEKNSACIRAAAGFGKRQRRKMYVVQVRVFHAHLESTAESKSCPPPQVSPAGRSVGAAPQRRRIIALLAVFGVLSKNKLPLLLFWPLKRPLTKTARSNRSVLFLITLRSLSVAEDPARTSLHNRWCFEGTIWGHHMS